MASKPHPLEHPNLRNYNQAMHPGFLEQAVRTYPTPFSCGANVRSVQLFRYRTHLS